MDGEEAKNKPADDEATESDEEEFKMSQEELDKNLLTAARENSIEEVEHWLKEKANPMVHIENWSPLLWAACNGSEEIVRLLIKHNAHTEYLQQPKNHSDEIAANDGEEEEENDPFVKPPDAKKIGKYTPLHWASYKGFYKVVWLLLKAGMSPIDIDQYGNTAIHQAAASGNIEVLKCFLARGVDIDQVNARGDSPVNLATVPETKALILKTMKTLVCQKPGCKTKFDFKNFRYYCQQSDKFYCSKDSITQWVHEKWDSEAEERPTCRSVEIQKKIEGYEDQLRTAMATDQFEPVDVAMNLVRDIDLDVRLRKSAEVQHMRLMHELQIRNFLKSKEHHENYKEIRKDIESVNKMLDKASSLDIELDNKLVVEVNNFTEKLTTQRNLRKQRDLMLEGISDADEMKVAKLQDLVDGAKQNAVGPDYVANAEKLLGQMKGNIRARDTLKMLVDYPLREYPEPEELDPKKKGAKAPPPKKKKKKDNFDTPAWATELVDVQNKVKEMQELAADRDNLHLDEGFLGEVKEQMDRFKKEIAFRKAAEEEARLEAELKALKKKAKKK